MSGNMVSYTKQYFGFDYDRMPFGEIDSLVLSQVIYYNYAGTGFDSGEFTCTLAEFLKEHPDGNKEWEMPLNEDDELIRLLQMGGRHGNLRGCHFLAVKDDDAEKQFGALTFELKPGLYYIAFRGTDNSVTGWKEDLNLSYWDVIPAQAAALDYAKKIMDQFEGEFYIGGHSKGGNIAVYSAMNLPEEYQNRILAVYDHDGPGFAAHVYESEKYKRIRPLLHKTIPESSIIGLLWEEDNHYKVVKSKGIGPSQHITYTWLVEDDKLIEVDDTDRFAKHMKKTLERWMDELDPEERKRFIDSVFDAIAKTEVERFQDLGKDTFRKMKKFIEGVTEMPGEEKKHVFQAFRQLLKISAEEIID
jgi:hypothetical protein